MFQPPKRRDAALSSLNVAIKIVNFAKENSSITPATAAFESVSATLAVIRVGLLLIRLDQVQANGCRIP